MKPLLLVPLLTTLLAWAIPAAAQEAPPLWRVCVSDAKVPPYLYNDAKRPGIMERILLAAGHEVGLKTVILRYPTARCRAMMETGGLDAVTFAPSPTNLASFQFPMKDGAVDLSKRLVRLHLVWVKRPDSLYEWDGMTLTGGAPADLLVGTRASMMAAIDPLTRMGFKIDSATSNAVQMLQKLKLGRLDLAVALKEEVEQAMLDPALGELVVLPRAMASVDFLPATRKNLPPQLQAQVEAWWAAIARLRELPEYRVVN